MAFVVACEDHDAWLIDGCPTCDAPLGAEDAVADGYACRQCHTQWTAPMTTAGPFFSQAIQMQHWLIDALYSAEDLMVGTRVVPLKDLLHGLRLLRRLDRRLDRAHGAVATIENLRVGDRILHLEQWAALLSVWPDGLVERARAVGLSRHPFHGDTTPEWVQVGLSALRKVWPRRPAPRNEDPMLRKLRRRHPANWRSRYAHRLVRLAVPM
ncbi:MAG: hypothetical protein M3Y70_03385 [Pseudomonadota bacterium]|nr:hypothetical protein [Pseudomonadota bacterium]